MNFEHDDGVLVCKKHRTPIQKNSNGGCPKCQLRFFQNHDGTWCVRQGGVSWLFPNVRQAKWFYRAMLRR